MTRARRHDAHGESAHLRTAYPRTARVNQVLREVVADEMERLADVDDRLRLLTVTGVDTTPDLRRATVFLASLPPGAAEALDGQRAHLQQAVGRQVRMKRTPHLEFQADPAVAGGERVEELLRHIHRAGPAGDATGEGTRTGDAAGGEETPPGGGGTGG